VKIRGFFCGGKFPPPSTEKKENNDVIVIFVDEV